jgi:hypothetical protein
MKNMLQSYINFWKEAESPLDYVINVWVTALGLLAITGFGKVLFELITNPPNSVMQLLGYLIH